MTESLGLSIGMANLVATRAGDAPVVRSSVLTLFEHRPTEIGLPDENPNLTEPGLVLRGFVERVGDRAPLVAADGTKYLGEVLTVEAIEAMARTAGWGTPVTIAVPAYWSEAQITALREEFFAQPDLVRGGVAPVLVSDATAAVAALRSNAGFPTNGVVALCDFGAGGTSITLMDAGSNFTHVGPSVRYSHFSGDAIDALLVNHLRDPEVTAADPAGTARIGSQNRLLRDCRHAKEQLSTATVTTVAAAAGAEVRLSRTEFEQVISESLDRLLDTVEETLRRNGIPETRLAAVATAGGGASIPLLTARLSERFRVPVHTTPQPACSAALGAALLGEQASAGSPTTAGAVVETPTEMVGTAGADMTVATSTAQAPEAEAALAWSQDADDTDEPVPYTGRDATGEYAREATESDYAADESYDKGQLPWYKRTALVLGVAGAGAAVLVAVVLAINLLTKSSPTESPPPNEPAPPQTSQTVTITGPNDITTVTVLPPPSPSSTQPSPSSTQPPTTTTTTPPPTTTTTPPPTTTTKPPTTTTTTPPPTTTSQVTTTPPPTTTRERLLFPRLEPPFRR